MAMTTKWLRFLPLFGILTAARVMAQTGALPWKAGDPPPLVAGLHLGNSRERLDSVMGRPTNIQHLGDGADALGYDSAGVVVSYARLDGVAIIDLRRRDAGAIDSIRVGDSFQQVLARWGQPTTQEADVRMYIVGWWAIVVRVDQKQGCVQMLSIGRVAG